MKQKSWLKFIGMATYACILLGCTSPSFITGGEASFPMAAPSPSSSLSSLIGDSGITREEAQLRDTLERQITLEFPLRIGMIHYNYQTLLEATEQTAAFKSAETVLKDSGLVKEVIQIPTSLLGSSATVDAIRQLGARFQTPVVLIVTGGHAFGRSKVQNLSFLDSFSEKAYFESNVQIDAIALDVFTGTFLTPFKIVAKEGPTLFDRADTQFTQQTYDLKKKAESQAWENLQRDFLKSLQALKVDIEKRTPQPSPSPTPTSTGA